MAQSSATKVLGYLRRPAFYLRSRRVDLGPVRTVCMLLGPNRNLTTMTAGVVALHPQCQVLNNAGKRHMRYADAWFADPSEEQFERFARRLLYISQGGKPGVYGGSVLLSHSFTRPEIREAHTRRFGRSQMKRDIRCLVWKSALRLTAHVRARDIDLLEVVEGNDRLRFLMPVRNPLDCALSNWRTHHYRRFEHLKGAPLEQVLDYFVSLTGWFLDLQRARPDRFFSMLQPDISPALLNDLARFLEVDPDPTWLEDCAQVLVKGRPYEYEPALVSAYHDALRRHLGQHPEERDKLAALVPGG